MTSVSSSVTVDSIKRKTHELERANYAIYEGYEKERKRMADILMRCPHNLSQFDDSQSFVTFVDNELRAPLLETQNITYLTLDHQKRFENIVNLLGNGIRKCCATALAPFFLCSLMDYHCNDVTKRDDQSIIHTFACVCTALLQHPSITIFFMRHVSPRLILISTLFEDMCKLQMNDGIKLFANQLLRNVHLLRSAHHYIDVRRLMYWTINELYALKQSEEFGDSAVWNTSSIIVLAFHYYKNSIFFRDEWGKRRNCLYLRDVRKCLSKLRHIKSIKDSAFNRLCNDLFIVTNFGQMDTLHSVQEILRNTEKIWTLKRKHMECLWVNCNKKAKQMDDGYLYVCKGCEVARYCSRRCQKKDWKHGHQHICAKYQFSDEHCNMYREGLTFSKRHYFWPKM